ncbi:MAG: adenylate/guanylate cyclase domain-containing protein [Acidobacteriota bacterium]
MASERDLQGEIERLERELSVLRERERLVQETDDVLELAMRERLPLALTVERVQPLLLQAAGAVSVHLRTWGEDLELHDFHSPAEGRQPDLVALSARTDADERVVDQDESTALVAQRIDVAGHSFGCAALHFDRQLDDAEVERVQGLLNAWCEELDNHLAAIERLRIKADITRSLSRALERPSLEEGIAEAIQLLQRHVAFDDLILVYRHEEGIEEVSLNYKIIRGGELVHDSRVNEDVEIGEFMRSAAFRDLSGEAMEPEPERVPRRFGIERYREEVLINGLRDREVVGRLVVTSTHEDFNSFERDVLERFADYMRMRIVDFNREWRYLAHCFPRPIVRRLMDDADYQERWLRPRERETAVMFCDISGFTRVSGEVLKEPALIGRLIDTWSERAVDIIWETGGVFDKMVGDCVIGLWGPPFYDEDPRTLCRAAADTARRIRDFTRTLGESGLMPELEGVDPPMGVAIGLNWCPLYVGLFGPDSDFTGFSSGMNNAARLQGVAVQDEILVMDSFVEQHGEGAFGEWRTAQVKNVAEPLRFATLD